MADYIGIYIEKDEHTDITLYLGDPKEEPDYPLLKDYISDMGFDPDSDEGLWQYWFDYFSGDPKELEVQKKSGKSPTELIGDLDQTLDPDSGEARSWMETVYEMKESPAARMRTFLIYELETKIQGLQFFEGDRPGSNLCFCSAENMETVAKLKKALESNGFEVEIERFTW
jgi:hypothetical protein